MAVRKFAYGNRSLAAFGLLVVTSQAFHPLILLAPHGGQTASWLIMLMAGALALAMVWPVAVVLRSMPEGTLIDLAEAAAGRIGAAMAGAALTAVLCFVGGMILRETSEMAITAAYPHTPQTFATVSLLAGAVYVAFADPSGLVRLGRLFLPVLLGAMFSMLAFSMGRGKWEYLQPLWGPGPAPLVLRTPEMAMFFAPLVLLPLLADGVRERARLVRWTLFVPAAGGMILAAVKVVLAKTYPYPMGTYVTFPMHAAARILLGGRFFERMEGAWLFLWVVATTILLGALIFGAARAFSQAFRFPRHTTAVPALSAVVLAVAFFPSNQADTIMLHERAGLWVFGLALGLPAVLALIAAVRKGSGRRAI